MCVVIRVRKRKNFYVARNSLFEKYKNVVVWMTGRAAGKTHGPNVLFSHESCLYHLKYLGVIQNYKRKIALFVTSDLIKPRRFTTIIKLLDSQKGKKEKEREREREREIVIERIIKIKE